MASECPLALASQEGHQSVVRLLLDAPDIEVNAADEDGWTALNRAAQRGHVAIVSALLAMPGIDVNAATLIENSAGSREHGGWTPLMSAASHGHAHVASLLRAVEGVDLDATNADGSSALLLAAQGKRTACVLALLGKAPPPQAAPTPNAEHGRPSSSAQLPPPQLSKHIVGVGDGLDPVVLQVNQTDRYGFTALHHAARSGDAAMAEALLAVPGIDVNAEGDAKRWTPLMAAAFEGHTAVGKLLLASKGIDVNACNEDGWTALMWAARHGHMGMMAALLAAKGIDVNGATHAAVQGGVARHQMGAVAAKVEEVKSMLEAAAIAATTEDAHTASAEMHERLDQRRAKREGTLIASDDHGLIAYECSLGSRVGGGARVR